MRSNGASPGTGRPPHHPTPARSGSQHGRTARASSRSAHKALGSTMDGSSSSSRGRLGNSRSSGSDSARMAPLSATMPVTTGGGAAPPAAAPAARSTGRKLIPCSSRNAKPAASTARGRAAAGHQTVRSVAASGSAVAAAPLSGRAAHRPLSGSLPRLSTARAGGIPVVALGTDPATEGGEALPAYLANVAMPTQQQQQQHQHQHQQSTHPQLNATMSSGAVTPQPPPTRGGSAGASAARQRAGFHPTLTLTGRPRLGSGIAGAPPSSPHAPPVYVVGGAVVNPYVPVSPAVQQNVRGVVDGAASARCPGYVPIGPTITVMERGAEGGGGGGSSHLKGNSTRVEANSPVSASATAGVRLRAPPRLAESGYPSTPTVPGFQTVPRGGPRMGMTGRDEDGVFAIEAITSTRARHAGGLGGSGAAPAIASMEALRALYGTTADDVPALSTRAITPTGREPAPYSPNAPTPARHGPEKALAGSSTATVTPTHARGRVLSTVSSGENTSEGAARTLAGEILPELMTAPARSAALSAARRRIDWDVALPAGGHGGAPLPPAITFMDATGTPIAPLSCMHYTFNVATLTLTRDVEEDMRHMMPTKGAGPPSQHQQPLSITASNTAAAVRSAGQVFSQGITETSLFRVHGLVGLLPGIAERVGLDRAMEYQVRCQSGGVMLLSTPYVDADVGDLVMHLNPSLLGTVRLSIVGFDCSAVDPATGAVTESTNVLTVVVRSEHVPLPENCVVVGGGHGAGGQGAGGQPTSPGARQESYLIRVGQAGSTTSPHPGTTPIATPRMTPTAGLATDSPFPTTPPFGALANATARTASEQSSLGDRMSPLGFHLTLPSFPRDRPDGQGLSRLGPHTGMDSATAPAAVGEVAVVVPVTSPAALGVGGPGVGERHGHRDGGGSGYVFPATNPHELFYDACEVATRMYVMDSITRARAGERATREARLRHGSPASPASTATATVTATAVQDGWAEGSPHPPLTASVEDGDDALSDSGLPALPAAFAQTGAAGSTPSVHGPASGSPGGGGGGGGVAAEKEDRHSGKERLWRPRADLSASSPVTSLQSPLSHMRLADWQDRLTALLRGEDRDLLEAETRAQVKRQAKSELPDSIVAGLANGAVGAGTTSAGGHGTSSSGNSLRLALYRAGNAAASGGGGGGFTGVGESTSAPASPASATSLQAIRSLRRLVLALLLEENRGSPQLFADTVALCGHLGRAAVLRTVAVTGGTREGLHSAAAAALASTPKFSDTADRAGTLSEKERQNVLLLVECLEVCLTAMVTIGCYAEAVNYATQRVHAQCLLEGDTTGAVCLAQRDLAEVLLFYGDAAAALRVAEDVLMLAEQLYEPGSTEELEAKLLVVVATLPVHAVTRAAELMAELMPCAADGPDDKPRTGEKPLPSSSTRVGSGAGASAGTALPPGLRATIYLVYALVKSAVDAAPDGARARAVLPVLDVDYALDTAVALLAGSGDLAEMEKSFSTVMPAAGAGLVAGAAAAGAAKTAAVVMGMQKRTRWNLLFLAGVEMMRHDRMDKGLHLLETIIEELTLGQRRFVERSHRSHLSAILWVVLVRWKMWRRPTEAAEMQPMLRRCVRRLTRNRGPYHPVVAAANLLLADALRFVPRSHALGIALRSFEAMQWTVSPRSSYILFAHAVCANLSIISHRWRPALEHANAALIVSQLNHTHPAMRTAQERDLLGALLRGPPTMEVGLQPSRLLSQLDTRVAEVEALHGTHSEHVVRPLINLAEAHFLLHDYAAALGCLQRALRLADDKGVLTALHTVVKPECQLAGRPGDVERRRLALSSLIQDPDRLLVVAGLLYSMGAVLDARGEAAEARDAYSRSLAVLEAANLQGSLSGVRVCRALAESCYSAEAYADGLAWALRAQRAVHATYANWPHEVAAVKALVSAVQEKVYEREGTFVVCARAPPDAVDSRMHEFELL